MKHIIDGKLMFKAKVKKIHFEKVKRHWCTLCPLGSNPVGAKGGRKRIDKAEGGWSAVHPPIYCKRLILPPKYTSSYFYFTRSRLTWYCGWCRWCSCWRARRRRWWLCCSSYWRPRQTQNQTQKPHSDDRLAPAILKVNSKTKNYCH